MVIGELLGNNAHRFPDRTALVWEDRRISWAELNNRANRLANGLIHRGLAPGTRVAFLLDNRPEIIELYFAIAKAGAIACPILSSSVGREVASIVNNVKAEALFVDAAYCSVIREIEEDLISAALLVGVGAGHSFPDDYEALIGASDPAAPGISVEPDSLCTIFHTSGTTGAPKGCMVRHRNKVMGRLAALVHCPHAEDDISLIFYPLALSFTTDILLANVLRGITTVLLPRFDPEIVLKTIEGERVTLTYVIEATFDRLLSHPVLETCDLSSLRYLYATSATKDTSEGVRRFRKLKGFRAKFWNAYGSTEGGGWITHCGPEEIERSLIDPEYSNVFRSIGREAMLCRIECVDEAGNALPSGETGEMVISAPWLFSGYWNQPGRTAEVLRNGKYYTGDLASRDENGFIFLQGRRKDMIKSGGMNVYPVEVEAVFKSHPKIREVAVIGIPDVHWGEKVVACVAARSPVSEKDILAYCGERLAGYKIPKSIYFYDMLPSDKVGKVLKRQLREELSGVETIERKVHAG